MLPPALRVKSRRADVTTRPRKPFPYAVKQARLECETGFLVLLKARPLAPAPADLSAPDIFSHAPAAHRSCHCRWQALKRAARVGATSLGRRGISAPQVGSGPRPPLLLQSRADVA